MFIILKSKFSRKCCDLEDGADLSFFFWCVLKKRNNRRFEDLERFLEDILASCSSFVSLHGGFNVPTVA